MGAIGDFFGGQAKIRQLPPELQQLANGNIEIANALYDIFNANAAAAPGWTDSINNYLGGARDQLDTAIDFGNESAANARDLWESEWQPTSRKTAQEIGAAGSLARQGQEATRARETTTAEIDASLRQLMRESGRRGNTGTAFNAQTALSRGAAAASAANAARFAERERGEAIRRQFLPYADSYGDTALQRSVMPSSLTEKQGGLTRQMAGTLTSILGQGLPFAQQGLAHNQNAFDQNQSIWDMQVWRDMSNANRRNNMIETGLNLAGDFFGFPEVGSGLRGGGGGEGINVGGIAGKIKSGFGNLFSSNPTPTVSNVDLFTGHGT